MTSSQTVATVDHHFELKREVEIPALNLTVQEFEHTPTGAQHLHLSADVSENVFMVALRTVPEDSTGVAHILEHTALCGSEKFPVRDPFFMMLRRSLNTFMNAFTSSDWTAYPFATQNKKDFDNLLSVYLDAVFFSRLDPLDFAQEGHRVEFENDDPNRQLQFKGVVFNEMKGAMSSINSVLWDRLCFELFPHNTYHFNSGGDPECIPDLSYAQLRAFYESHYHPTNAIFLTFGDIPAAEHQTHFESRALSRFQRLDHKIEVALEAPFQAPKVATHTYAIDAEDPTANKTHLIMGWKLGESADLMDMLEGQIISAVLMENSASPLMHYLETTALGSAPSPLCGLEDSMREMVLCCGIEGSEPEHAAAFESEVLRRIEGIANDGVNEDKLEAILHQIELHQREISGDGMPYGLNLMLRALGAATHYGDAVATLDLDPALAELRRRIKSPDYIPLLVRRLILDNPHRVRLTVVPDATLNSQRQARETKRLASMAAEMNDTDRANVIDLAARLRARQAQSDDPDVLPRVTLEDIPAETSAPTASESHTGATKSLNFATGTNGIVYQQLLQRLPELDQRDLDMLPLMTGLLSDIGVAGDDYLATQDRQSATVGSIGAAALTRSDRLNPQLSDGWWFVSSKALANRVEQQAELMFDMATRARWDEQSRIRELVSQIRARRDHSITGSGHSLAMTAACAGMSPLALRAHEQGGLAGIQRLRALDDSLDTPAGRDDLCHSLQSLYSRLQTRGECVMATIADAEHLDIASKHLLDQCGALSTNATLSPWKLPEIRSQRRELWITNTAVNFCARAYPTVPAGHPDAPILSVLGAFLRNGFLHRSIREQGGAYGGGAGQDSQIAAFRFFSYRDPRLTETLDDFDASLDWIRNADLDERALEEAILSVVSSLDKPGSPAGEAKKQLQDQLFGRTAEHRTAFRQGVIHTQLDDLRRVVDTYFLPELASTAVITHSELGTSPAVVALGLETRHLQ
jgi:Zn-dependent M16 (insulinase) family peptidase